MQATGNRSIEGSGREKPALLLRDVGLTFGGLFAPDGVILSVSSGGIYGLFGPIGAGKSPCEQIVVMHLGRKLAEGVPVKIQSDLGVVAAYLGTPT